MISFGGQLLTHNKQKKTIQCRRRSAGGEPFDSVLRKLA